MGIFESKAASSAQLKGAKTVVAGIGGLEIEIGIGIGFIGIGGSKGLEAVGIGGSVCVDMVAEVDEEIIGGFV
jgi:hypothetical protein